MPSPPRSITALSTMSIPLLPNPFYRSLSLPLPSSYHSKSEVEHEPSAKVTDKPATNGTALHVVLDTLTPTPDVALVLDVESEVPAAKAVQETAVPAAAVGTQAGREGGRRGSLAPLLS